MNDEQIVQILAKEDEEFKQLADEHRLLDLQVAGLSGKHYLSTEEEIEKKRIQKLKLLKKDRMEELIIRYRKSHSHSTN
ncbi:MAG: hypothetical protein M0Z58_07565 [Nitrospiraceae bacterium]|nr:hypothetical protein [Nitrospiraceae bacterium]